MWAIWYQGESNAGRAEQYRSLFPDMIRCWRRNWAEPDFTFVCVQLAPFKAIQSELGEGNELAEEVARYWPGFVRLWPTYESHFRATGERTLFVLEPTEAS